MREAARQPSRRRRHGIGFRSHTPNGKRVAVKILHPHVAVDPSIQQRFLREGYLANSINHDGAVSVLDDDIGEDGSAFLVMELLEGETLEARAERFGGKLPLKDVISLGEQLLNVRFARHGEEHLQPSLHDLIQHGRLGLVALVSFAQGGVFGHDVKTGHSAMSSPMPNEQLNEFRGLSVVAWWRVAMPIGTFALPLQRERP